MMRTDDALILEAYLKADEHDEKDLKNPEERGEVALAYQILTQVDKLEHNLASELKDDLADRQKALKAIKELTNKLLEMHGAQHD